MCLTNERIVAIHVYAFMRSASSLHAYMLDDLVYYRGGEGERRRRRQRRRRAKEKEEKRIFVMTRQAESQPKHFFLFTIFSMKSRPRASHFLFSVFFFENYSLHVTCMSVWHTMVVERIVASIPWSLSASSLHMSWDINRIVAT